MNIDDEIQLLKSVQEKLAELSNEVDYLRSGLDSIAKVYEGGRDTSIERASQAYDMRCTARAILDGSFKATANS